MEPITYEQFKERLAGESYQSLHAMAKERGVVVAGNISRENLYAQLYESLDVPKSTSDEEPKKSPLDPPPQKAKPSGVVYHVYLRSPMDRYRGDRFWKRGMTEVPAETMTEETLEALRGDKCFRVIKVENAEEIK